VRLFEDLFGTGVPTPPPAWVPRREPSSFGVTA
jgi:hypothetical protein